MPAMAMSNREIVDALYKVLNARDWDTFEKFVDADYVWEMPQSGERVRGISANQEMNKNYPGLPTNELRRVTGSADRWVTTPSWTVLKVTGTGDEYTAEATVTYPDGSVWHSVDILHFRAGKIHRHTSYFAPTLEPAEWRARWVERF
jgi:ketosteroid isomerase-like protein